MNHFYEPPEEQTLKEEIVHDAQEAAEQAAAHAEVARYDQEQVELTDLCRRYGLFLTAEQREAVDHHESTGLYVRQVKDSPNTVWIDAGLERLFFDTLGVHAHVELGTHGGSIVTLLDYDPLEIPF